MRRVTTGPGFRGRSGRIALAALLTSLACTTFVPVDGALPVNARASFSGERGLLLVGATPQASQHELTCPMLSFEGKVLRVMGDTIQLTNISKHTATREAPRGCLQVYEGRVIVDASAPVAVKTAQHDPNSGGGVMVLILMGTLGVLAILSTLTLG